MTLLKVAGIETFYGASQALFGVDLDIAEGEVVALMGRNGMGKTTTIRSICGLSRPRSRHDRICRRRHCAANSRSGSPASASGWCRKAGAAFPI